MPTTKIETPTGTITIVAPSTVPSDSRAEQLRALYQTHVKTVRPGDHWKSACYAEVAAEIAGDVAEAMTFMGSLVDKRVQLADGRVRIESAGYWAHGF